MPARREDRSCSVKGCPAPFYAKEMCQRHYYRTKRSGSPTAFLIAQKYDKFDDQGNRWCSGHKSWLPPDQFFASSTGRCRTCKRLEKYALTLDEFVAMGGEAADLCPLCQKRPANVIDHDHSTGKVRGMLCKQCNAAIGTLTEEGILRTLEYLGRHGGKKL